MFRIDGSHDVVGVRVEIDRTFVVDEPDDARETLLGQLDRHHDRTERTHVAARLIAGLVDLAAEGRVVEQELEELEDLVLGEGEDVLLQIRHVVRVAGDLEGVRNRSPESRRARETREPDVAEVGVDFRHLLLHLRPQDGVFLRDLTPRFFSTFGIVVDHPQQHVERVPEDGGRTDVALAEHGHDFRVVQHGNSPGDAVKHGPMIARLMAQMMTEMVGNRY